MVSRSTVIRSAALTSAAADASVGTYTVPALKGGRLHTVIVGYEGTTETGVSQGGKVTLTNSAVDWVPFELELPVQESLVDTEGGLANQPAPIAYNIPKNLPSKSVVTAKVHLNDNGSTIVIVQLMWEG